MSLYSSPQDSQQFELFPSGDARPSGGKDGLFSRKVSLALEHLVIIGIGVLVLCVGVFSAGVERGKYVAVQKADDLEINLANPENDAIIAPSSRASRTPAKVLPVVTRPSVSTQQPVRAAVEGRDIVVDVPVPAELRQPEPLPGGVYTIQVASFKQAKFASQEAEVLKTRGYEAFSMMKGSYYLVCVGKYKNKTQAESISKSLKSKYKDNLIRRL